MPPACGAFSEPLTNTDLHAPFSAGVSDMTFTDVNECCVICAAAEACEGFVVLRTHCYFKGLMATKFPNEGRLAFLRTYPPPPRAPPLPPSPPAFPLGATIQWSAFGGSHRPSDDVVIPADEVWLLDQNASVRSLTIHGTLRWDVTADGLCLRTGFIHVLGGGVFEVGNASVPMERQATIELIANGAVHPYLGSQFLAGELLPLSQSLSPGAFNNVSR